MNLVCLGINHRTAPVELREKMWFANSELPEVLARIREKYAREAVLVSTCNRTELFYVPRPDSINGTPFWKIFAGFKQTQETLTEDNFYWLNGLNAALHLYKVTAGIDSMVLGDVQISSQVKEAFQIAQEHHFTGIVLNRLFANALHVGKRARTETEIGDGAVSVSYAAAELASKIFEDLSKRSALLIGAGETGKLTAKHLVGRNLGKLLLTNRTRAHAETVASQLSGTVIDFDNFKSELRNVDIIISSVNVSNYILTASDVRQAMRSRGNRSLFIIDIGVPRNIDPAVDSIENVFLHDIDGLNNIIDNNLAHRQAEVPKVQQIILDELTQFFTWYKSLDVSPTIQELREQFEQIRQSELDKHLHHFDQEKQNEVDMLTKRIVNKILHTPMVNLKSNAGGVGDDETQRKIYLIRHLFGLDKKS